MLPVARSDRGVRSVALAASRLDVGDGVEELAGEEVNEGRLRARSCTKLAVLSLSLTISPVHHWDCTHVISNVNRLPTIISTIQPLSSHNDADPDAANPCAQAICRCVFCLL
jgi:hypothetical protein